MASKKIVLLISNPQAYIYHVGAEEKKFAAEMNHLYESISYIYIPLLNMFASLEKDGVPFRIALVLSPVLCTLLKDPIVQQQYIAWLDGKIALGKSELERCAGDTAMCDVVKYHLEKAQEDRFCFTAVYGQDLLKKISEYQKKAMSNCLRPAVRISFCRIMRIWAKCSTRRSKRVYMHTALFSANARPVFGCPKWAICRALSA